MGMKCTMRKIVIMWYFISWQMTTTPGESPWGHRHKSRELRYSCQDPREILRAPWTARRSNHSILKEIRPGCSLEGLMLKLKLQYFGHLMRRVDSLEITLMLGGIRGRRRRGRQKMRWLDGITNSMDMSLSSSGSWWWTGKPGVLQSMGSQKVGQDSASELIWA